MRRRKRGWENEDLFLEGEERKGLVVYMLDEDKLLLNESGIRTRAVKGIWKCEVISTGSHRMIRIR
jgi:hypothetical protein